MTFIILSSAILLASATLALLAVSQLQQSLADEKGNQSLYLAEGCMADALLASFYDRDYSGSTGPLPEGDCTVTVSKAGNNWVLVSTGTVSGGYTRRVRVNILRDNQIQILSWKEVE